MPAVNIDFRAYRSGGFPHLSTTELKGLRQKRAAGGAQVSVVYPDSLAIPLYLAPGIRIAGQCRLQGDYRKPQAAVKGRPKTSVDTVRVYIYMAPGAALPDRFNAVTTEPVRALPVLMRSTTRRVRLVRPSRSRVVPDSIDVSIEVEPLIFKSRKVVIEPVNVPHDIKLRITFPGADRRVLYDSYEPVYHKRPAFPWWLPITGH